MYRGSSPTLASCIELRLGPMGFATVPHDDACRALGVEQLFRRKTWNTNRGVVLATPSGPDLRWYVDALRTTAGACIGSSWWNQLGLQVVLQTVGLPSRDVLDGLVDDINHQGVLVQSVFAFDRSSLATVNARTWGQIITGRFQDAIEAAIRDLASRGASGIESERK